MIIIIWLFPLSIFVLSNGCYERYSKSVSRVSIDNCIQQASHKGDLLCLSQDGWHVSGCTTAEFLNPSRRRLRHIQLGPEWVFVKLISTPFSRDLWQSTKQLSDRGSPFIFAPLHHDMRVNQTLYCPLSAAITLWLKIFSLFSLR